MLPHYDLSVIIWLLLWIESNWCKENKPMLSHVKRLSVLKGSYLSLWWSVHAGKTLTARNFRASLWRQWTEMKMLNHLFPLREMKPALSTCKEKFQQCQVMKIFWVEDKLSLRRVIGEMWKNKAKSIPTSWWASVIYPFPLTVWTKENYSWFRTLLSSRYLLANSDYLVCGR